MTEGLPVTFIINGQRNIVLKHLAEAKVFWHSVGLSPQMETEPRYMEHFGIATVEAMAAGCVPVVAAYGGQPEIVEDECSGFLCRDMEGFVQRTVLLANAENLRMRMSQRARDRSRAFHPDIFTQQFRRRISQWCEDRIPQENPLARSSVSPTTVSHYGKDRQ
jgi:glycosyltransferase involved in cell wall biosynthesis